MITYEEAENKIIKILSLLKELEKDLNAASETELSSNEELQEMYQWVTDCLENQPIHMNYTSFSGLINDLVTLKNAQ